MKALSHCTYFVGSGKGGVGKSTVTVNLAVALSQQGQRVGVLDADVYGPSIPIMLGLRRLAPRIIEGADGQEKVLPFTKYGIQAVSLGFFVEEARSVVWRGPMLHGALKKLLQDMEWGELDVLLIDLPPGTGDVPLTLSQLLKIDGAVVVTTPQEVAMLDAVKAINSFDQLNVPLIGIIENMAGFTPPGSDVVYDIFGKGKGEELAYKFQTRLLGSIPLIPAIRIGGDEGQPAACSQSQERGGFYFHQIARQFNEAVTHAD